MKTKMKSSSVIWTAILFGLGIIFSSTCQKQKTGWRGKIETIDGVKVVHNFEPDPEQSFKPIQFIIDLSIGEEEGDENYMFSAPRDIDADSQGNIYVLDFREFTVKKYDSQGKHIKNIGRAGQGPGEFDYPRYLCVSEHGNIYVTELLERKVDVFNSDGEYQKSLNVDRHDQIAITKKEELIIGASFPEEVEKNEIQYFYKVGKYDQQKDEIHDFYIQRRLRFDRISNDTFTYDYPLFVRWDINSKDHIIIATANKYELKVFAPDGRLLSKYILDIKPIPVSGETKRKVSEMLDRTKSVISFDERELRKLVEYYPVFNCISIDEKDRIWVERYDPFRRDKALKEIIFDVFSPEGKLLFTTKIEMDIYPQLIFKNGYIYTLARDESGYTKALRLRIAE